MYKGEVDNIRADPKKRLTEIALGFQDSMSRLFINIQGIFSENWKGDDIIYREERKNDLLVEFIKN